MSNINLDPKKLLGFKIIADSERPLMLHSPKIGGKGCPVISTDASSTENARSLVRQDGH